MAGIFRQKKTENYIPFVQKNCRVYYTWAQGATVTVSCNAVPAPVMAGCGGTESHHNSSPGWPAEQRLAPPHGPPGPDVPESNIAARAMVTVAALRIILGRAPVSGPAREGTGNYSSPNGIGPGPPMQLEAAVPVSRSSRGAPGAGVPRTGPAGGLPPTVTIMITA